MLAGINDALKHGKLSEVQGTMCKSKPIRQNKQADRLLTDKIGGKQKSKGSSKVPTGWYSAGMFA